MPGVIGDDWLNTEDLFKLLHAELPLDAVMLRPACLWRTKETDETRTRYILEVRVDKLEHGDEPGRCAEQDKDGVAQASMLTSTWLKRLST